MTNITCISTHGIYGDPSSPITAVATHGIYVEYTQVIIWQPVFVTVKKPQVQLAMKVPGVNIDVKTPSVKIALK
jgi:hypothetical protein